MRILAVDTTTPVGSVAIVDDPGVVAELSTAGRDRHGETLLSDIRDVFDRAGLTLDDIELLAVGIGPGSFTGLRVGLAAVKGLGLASGHPVVGVGSLEALASALPSSDGLVAPVLDASKGEVFASLYERHPDGLGREWVAPFHAEPLTVVEKLRGAIGDRPVAVSGTGFRRYQTVFSDGMPKTMMAASPLFDVPRASVVAAVAGRRFRERGPDDLATLEPRYVRGSDARLPKG